ncbi:hypothetical protein D3C72_1774210 [compost metagenome]
MKKLLAIFALLVPLSAMAENKVEKLCQVLIPDIQKGYPLSNIALTPSGAVLSKDEVPIIHCLYTAAYHPDLAVINNSIAVAVYVDVDTAAKTFTVEFM